MLPDREHEIHKNDENIMKAMGVVSGDAIPRLYRNETIVMRIVGELIDLQLNEALQIPVEKFSSSKQSKLIIDRYRNASTSAINRLKRMIPHATKKFEVKTRKKNIYVLRIE